MDEMSLMELWEARDLFAAPIACAAMAGLCLGVLSVFIVLKRMVFISAAVSQCAGLGVAFAFWVEMMAGVHLPPVLVATVVAVAATLLCALDPRRLGVSRDAILGLVYALSGSLSVLIGEKLAQEAHDIQSILFGSAVLVSDEDAALVAACSAAILLLGAWNYRGVAFAVFDPAASRAQKLPVALLNGALLVSIGVMVGVSARALGALPVFAFSTLPAVAALRCRLPLKGVLVLAGLLGAFAGAFGYLTAFRLNMSVGASQTTVAGVVALLAIGISAHVGRFRRSRSGEG